MDVADVADVAMSDDWKWTVSTHDQCEIQKPADIQKYVLVFLAPEWDTIESNGTIACTALCMKLARIDNVEVYCAVPQYTLEQQALAKSVGVTLLKPVVRYLFTLSM